LPIKIESGNLKVALIGCGVVSWVEIFPVMSSFSRKKNPQRRTYMAVWRSLTMTYDRRVDQPSARLRSAGGREGVGCHNVDT
jgi:hypothetical protein